MTMTENIIIALIGMAGSIGGSALLINWRLKELEKKVSEHNNYSKLFADTSKDIAVIQRDVQYIIERLNKVEANE